MFIPEHFPDIAQQEARFERALVAFRPEEHERMRAALRFAARAHEGQERVGPGHIPYLIHPIRVACSLVDEFHEMNADAFTAALLHDVVEDGGVTIAELAARFGTRVCGIVAALTWRKGTDAKWQQADALCRQPRIIRLIKASDIIDNSRAMWHMTDRARILRMLYGYAHWGRRIVESIGAPATVFLDAALKKSTSIAFARDADPPFASNRGKSLAIGMPHATCHMQSVARYPIRTHVIAPEDDLVDLVRRYAVTHLQSGDLLAISERIVAITQGRAYPVADIRPSRWAKFLVWFVTKSPYGIGLGAPETMELAIREVGMARMLLAAGVAAMTKPFGIRGMFYRVVGKHINAIDGPCDYTIPLPVGRDDAMARGHTGVRYAKLGPKEPNRVAERLAREIGVDVAIVDANDLGVNVLGASEDVDRAFVAAAFKDNPLGQSNEQTPMAVVRSCAP